MPVHKSLPLARGVRVLKRQDGLIALEKPCGIRSHPNKPGADMQSLLTVPYDASEQAYLLPIPEVRDMGQAGANAGKPASPEAEKLYLLHRLDAPTSGVILLCEDVELSRSVRQAFSENRVKKTYYAVTPILPSLRSPWQDCLERSRDGKGVRVAASSSRGEVALTFVKRLRVRATTPKLMLLMLEPKTGRTHQLRVQAAHRRIPILGDATYGNFALNRRIAEVFGVKRLCLHAGQIQLSYMHAGKRREFTAQSELPEEFESFFAK